MSDFNEKKHNWTPHLSEIDSQNNFNKNKSPKGEGWISMLEASKLCAYSQEYLSLLARREKIFSKKIGRNWYTTREAIEDYLKTQSVFVSMPKNIFGKLTASLTPEEPNEVLGHEGHSKVFEEFEKLNPQIFFGTPKEIKPQNPVITQPQKPSALVVPKIENNQFKKEADKLEEMLMQGQEVLPKQEILEDPVLKKLDRLSGSLELFADRVTRKLEQPKEEPLTPEQKEFIDSGIYSPAYRFRMFDKYARSMMSSPVRMMTIMITSVVMIFIIAGGFSFGQADYIVQQIKKAFKDADTIQGHFPGTHANEVLVLDKAGNVSIFGHIETEGQLRSHAPEGVAPIVVDSVTRVDNLNAEYLNGLGTNDFTLAFVTKNGNLTYEDVKLEGNVEVGKTLIVKGATKLLDSLQVYGNLGVFGDAVFGKDIVLQKGTIKISNTSLIKNLNAEFLDGTRKQDINLNFVTSNGANTSNSISVGGLEVNGTSQFNGVGFFNKGVWGSTGSFGSLGVASDASIGKKDNPDGSGFEVYSKYFSINNVGNTRVGGTLSAGNTTVGDLTVGGSVKSDLIPSGSLDLGSTTNPWTNIFGTTANFGNLVVSGSVDFSGTTSKSFVINTDNTTADTEDSYLAFERGTTTPNAQLKWNSTQNRFEFNESLFIASSSAETIFSVSGGPASISNTLYVQNSGNVGINYGDTLDAKFEVGGTASISGTLTTSTITASGLLSFSGTNHAG
ncbi:MAG: YadA domain-containing structural protein, partial [Parcubacteria group bacterium GW2011_GWA1_36_12]